MKTYLVGGAVRDRLLDIPVSDRDWVVVGSSPDQMVNKGFRPVGKDFPVFLHPTSHEEYALARTERKVSTGYHGFVFNTSPDVTLAQDLQRRDLTINAIAQDENGHLIDPWGGMNDLDARILRHVSPAFAEDPLRVLRVARFAAKLAEQKFTIADNTLALMRQLSVSGELETLAAERVWQELVAVLRYPNPIPFFESMRAAGALQVLLPELDRLYGVPQPAEHHPEIDSALHTLLVLEQACSLSNDPKVRFAALCHDLGKGTTDPAAWPSHHGHEERGGQLCQTLCQRLKSPADYRELAVITARFHTHCHRAFELRPNTLLKLFESTDALRRPQRFEEFLLCCISDARGRLGADTRHYPQADFLRGALAAIQRLDAAAIAAKHRQQGGNAIAKAIREAKLQQLTHYRQALPANEQQPPIA